MSMPYSRVVVGFGLGMLMLVVALAPIGLPPPANVDASHDGPTTSHLLEPDRHGRNAGRIVRNVIVGNAIPVCSDDLPISTKAAAERWNSFFGKQVFQLEANGTVFESTDPRCAWRASNASLGIGSVLVEQDLTGCRQVATGCIYLDAGGAPNREWDTYIGRPAIYIQNYPTEDVLFNRRDVLPDGHDRVTRTVTHELGHVFGLDDYPSRFCGPAPPGTPDRLDYTTVPTIMGPAQRADGTTSDCHSASPTSKDERDYRLSYVPEDPIALPDEATSPLANEVLIAWDAFNVHVENEFRIYRKRAEGIWELAGIHAALPLPPPRLILPLPEIGEVRQRARVTLRGQPLGSQRYRVVALTRAPLQDGHVAASGEIGVIVKGPPPNRPTGLTASGVVLGINLSWDEATDDPPINGYQHRIDSGEWQDIPSSNASTTSYQVRGMLVAGTTYAVEIRAVRALVPSEASNAATATPTARPQPPPPQYVTIQLVDGVTRAVWPGATVSVAAAVRGVPIATVWYWVAETDTWLVYATDPTVPPYLITLTTLHTGRIYDFSATEAYSWRIRVPSTSARAQAAPTSTPAEPGWTATVTCASGFGPIRLGAAPTEAEAITAANWIIDHPHGCAGSGIYIISDESGDD